MQIEIDPKFAFQSVEHFNASRRTRDRQLVSDRHVSELFCPSNVRNAVADNVQHHASQVMPLLNNKPWVPTALQAPPGTGNDAKIYHVRQTKEIFTTYEAYTARLKLLQSKQWSSNGKAGLNYEEAILEDKRAEDWLKEVNRRVSSNRLSSPGLRAYVPFITNHNAEAVAPVC